MNNNFQRLPKGCFRAVTINMPTNNTIAANNLYKYILLLSKVAREISGKNRKYNCRLGNNPLEINDI